MQGDAVDLFKFPAPRFHDGDGGRYIGTGNCLINADPESGFINAGTYRMQLHERDLMGLWMSPGQHGRMICAKYWEQGKSCPVVVAFSADPLLFTLAHTKVAWGNSELDYAGGIMGRPLSDYSRAVDRPADSRRRRNRHRRRRAAARRRVAARGTFR